MDIAVSVEFENFAGKRKRSYKDTPMIQQLKLQAVFDVHRAIREQLPI